MWLFTLINLLDNEHQILQISDLAFDGALGLVDLIIPNITRSPLFENSDLNLILHKDLENNSIDQAL